MILYTAKFPLEILPYSRYELYFKENAFTLKRDQLHRVLASLKVHYKYQFKILTSIAGSDYPKKKNRFQLAYELLTLRFNTRVRIKIYTTELIPIDSIERLYLAASWWECEAWDMFGIFFSKHHDLRRLLTDYGFEGHPLRKDFPLSGFLEMRYSPNKDKVISQEIELAQEYRIFDFSSSWEKFYSNPYEKN